MSFCCERSDDSSAPELPRFSAIPMTPKIVLIGKYGIGKTSLVTKYANKDYTGVGNTSRFDYSQEIIGGQECQIWDTAGSEKFSSMMPMYLRGATIVLVAADMTTGSEKVHISLREWIEIACKYAPTEARILLVGTKSDLIPSNEIKPMCSAVNIFLSAEPFLHEHVCAVLYPTSAASGDGITEVFDHIGEHLSANGCK